MTAMRRFRYEPLLAILAAAALWVVILTPFAAKASPYSIDTYTGNGTQTAYAVSFPYIQQSDVTVTVAGVATTAFTWTSPSTITFTTAPASGAAIVIARHTTLASPNVVFQAGSLASQDLNSSVLQELYLQQEAYDTQQSGPVINFNGRGGAVTLTQADLNGAAAGGMTIGGILNGGSFGLELGGGIFPQTPSAFTIGSYANPWGAAYTTSLGFGPYTLPGWLIGPQTGDLAFSSLGDGTTCHELDYGTPQTPTTGTAAIIERFNIRSCAVGVTLNAPQGQSIINSFESVTFPYKTTFTFDANTVFPGIGNAGGQQVATGTASANNGVLTVTADSGVISVGDFIYDSQCQLATSTGFACGFVSITANAGSGGTPCNGVACTGSGGTGTYALSYNPFPITAESVSIASHPVLVLPWLGPTTIYGDQCTSPQQFIINGVTNRNQQLLMGYDTCNNEAIFQAILQGTAYEPLDLNAAGGNVGVGFAAGAAIPSKFAVNGNAQALAVITVPVAIASLPASPVAGERAMVNNATACTFMTAVTAGGAVVCPVVYTTSWVAG
jgi:hypothetical protein